MPRRRRRASGWNNGEVTEKGYETGQVVLLEQEPLFIGEGSSVPPDRTNQGEMIRRVARAKLAAWGDPRSAEDWQLYTNMEGVGVAARALTGALTRAKRLLHETFRDLKKVPRMGNAFKIGLEKAVNKALNLVVYPVQDQFAHYGAADTDPRTIAWDALWQYAKEFFGKTTVWWVD